MDYFIASHDHCCTKNLTAQNAVATAINECYCSNIRANPLSTICITPGGLCHYAKKVCFDFKNNKVIRASNRFIVDHNKSKLYIKPVNVSEEIVNPIPHDKPYYIIYKETPYAVRLINKNCFTGVDLVTCQEETFYFIPDEDGFIYVDKIFSADEEIQKAGLCITPEKYTKLKEEEFNK